MAWYAGSRYTPQGDNMDRRQHKLYLPGGKGSVSIGTPVKSHKDFDEAVLLMLKEEGYGPRDAIETARLRWPALFAAWTGQLTSPR